MSKAYIENTITGNTIREITNPITYLFRHDREVNRFVVKALDHGEGCLIAELDNNTRLIMFWASYAVMMDVMLKTRAWKNHFSGTNIYKVCYRPELGHYTMTWNIG